VRYVVLLRYGFGTGFTFRPVLKIDRSQDGHVRCWETVEPFSGTTWSADGRFEWTSDGSGEQQSRREPLADVREPRIVHSIPGPKLLDAKLPAYASEIDQGATVQICAHAVIEEPHRVALQLILAPRGEEPFHRETVGDRRIDDGAPDLWVVLDRRGDDPPRRVAAVQRVLRWPPPLGAQAKP
jgi:hypothetical protein